MVELMIFALITGSFLLVSLVAAVVYKIKTHSKKRRKYTMDVSNDATYVIAAAPSMGLRVMPTGARTPAATGIPSVL